MQAINNTQKTHKRHTTHINDGVYNTIVKGIHDYKLYTNLEIFKEYKKYHETALIFDM